MRDSRFTDREMKIAAHTELADLMESEGFPVERRGQWGVMKDARYVVLKKDRYYDNYKHEWGDAITFLRDFKGMTFPEAVEHLLQYNGQARDTPEQRKVVPHKKEEKDEPFILPEANDDNRRVFSYLRKRGVAYQVIKSFVDAGLLYEDKQYHNCVFVGRDASGEAVFANKRGTYDKDGVGFKGDVPGSDKAVAFRLPGDPESDRVFVFESPIDLMSYMTLHRNIMGNAVALCCLHDAALETYLRENPHMKGIVFCLDADKWGREAAEKLSAKYASLGYTASCCLPPKGKDWNEYVQARQHQKKRANRQER